MCINLLKNMILSSVILLTGFAVRASEVGEDKRELETESRVSFQYGPKLNLRLSTLTPYESGNKSLNAKPGFGIGAGFFGRALLTEKWFLASSVNFNYDAMNLIMKSNYGIGLIPDWEKYDLDIFSMEIPLHVGFRFPISDEMHYSVYSGVSGTFLLAAKVNGPHDSGRFDAFGYEGILKRNSFNVDIGINIELDNHALIDIGGKFGCLNQENRHVFGFNHMYYMNASIDVVFFL
ncbi:MAG: PorT family protein [Muribaculaceae bacterium]|nr:PorT family protein [Muribaculaceae bacterium]